MRKRSLLLAAGACLATLTLAVGSAVADPTGAPTFRALAGGGADGPENLMNELSNIITVNGTKVIGSYNVSGSAQITTKAPPANCTINRPGNGGAGIAALVTSQTNGDGCLQFARQVTNDSASRPGTNLTYIPYASDALSFVIRDDSPLTRSLTVADLFKIYDCDPEFAGINPLLGSFGAGTRRLFLTSIGHTDTSNFTTLNPCVTDGVPENRGIQLTQPGHIAPHSVAQFQSQKNGVTPDSTGRTILGSINGISATVVNNSSTIPREIFTVVPNSLVGTQPTNTVFVGSGSQVCQNSATIQKYGFGTHPNCGSTSIQTPPN
ncbi:MAG: hypothetical protein ACRDRG_08785 [Pseudonocardiaceae bacterium]